MVKTRKLRSSAKRSYERRRKDSRCKGLMRVKCRRTVGCKMADGKKRSFCRKMKSLRRTLKQRVKDTRGQGRGAPKEKGKGKSYKNRVPRRRGAPAQSGRVCPGSLGCLPSRAERARLAAEAEKEKTKQKGGRGCHMAFCRWA